MCYRQAVSDKTVHDLFHCLRAHEEGRFPRRQARETALIRRIDAGRRYQWHASCVSHNPSRLVILVSTDSADDFQMSSRPGCNPKLVQARRCTRASLTGSRRYCGKRDPELCSRAVSLGQCSQPDLLESSHHDRVIRSSPQFAVTLSCYELLNKYFPYPFGDEAHSKAGQAASGVQRPFQATDISRIRAMNGLRILLDCSSQFGMVGPEAVAKGVQNLPSSLRP